MKTISNIGIWARGILITTAAVVPYLLGDATFRAVATPQTLSILGAVGVMAATIRAYIDTSTSQGHNSGSDTTRSSSVSAEAVALNRLGAAISR